MKRKVSTWNKQQWMAFLADKEVYDILEVPAAGEPTIYFHSYRLPDCDIIFGFVDSETDISFEIHVGHEKTFIETDCTGKFKQKDRFILHNEEGPAFRKVSIFNESKEDYVLNGEKIDKEEFLKMLNKKILKKKIDNL